MGQENFPNIIDTKYLNNMEGMNSELPYVELIYQGMIGEKIPQNCSDKVFRALQAKGVSVVIDLRHDYTSNHFAKRCEAFGIRYFRYPVHKDEESIAYMTTHLLEFCELVQSECFYMMGIHRAYAALCIFWFFSKAVGPYPFELAQKVKQNKRLMNKVVPMLYAMVDYKEKIIQENNSLATEFIAEERALIASFVASEGPEKITFSFITFTLKQRNGSVAYDVSVRGLGILGHLYPATDKSGSWRYDIIRPRPESGWSWSFADAQTDIANILCQTIPLDPKFPTLPQSVQTCLALFKKMIQ